MKAEILLLILFLLITYGCFWTVIHLISKFNSAKNWVVTQANMQIVTLNRTVKYDQKTKKESKSKRLKISYEYDFKGRTFYNDKIYFNNSYLRGGKTTSRIYDCLRDAKLVEVYVNPENPSESVLIRKLLNTFITLIFLGLLGLAGALRAISHLFESIPTFDVDGKILALFLVSIIIVMIASDRFGRIHKYIKVLERN